MNEPDVFIPGRLSVRLAVRLQKQLSTDFNF